MEIPALGHHADALKAKPVIAQPLPQQHIVITTHMRYQLEKQDKGQGRTELSVKLRYSLANPACKVIGQRC